MEIVLWLPLIYVTLKSSVATNWARGRPANQSSTDGYPASLAVDGNNSTDFSDGSCTRTAVNDTDPWWMVNLEKPVPVSAVGLINRGDCCGERLHSVYVEVERGDGNTGLCIYHEDPFPSGEYSLLECGEVLTGIRVRIRKSADDSQDVLTLCEVIVLTMNESLHVGWSTWIIIKKDNCLSTCGWGVRRVAMTRRCRKAGGEGCVGVDTMTSTQTCQSVTPCPVDGGWDSWVTNGTGECSVTCGDGFRDIIQIRKCANPVPLHGGQKCLGSVRRVASEPCEAETLCSAHSKELNPFILAVIGIIIVCVVSGIALYCGLNRKHPLTDINVMYKNVQRRFSSLVGLSHPGDTDGKKLADHATFVATLHAAVEKEDDERTSPKTEQTEQTEKVERTQQIEHAEVHRGATYADNKAYIENEI